MNSLLSILYLQFMAFVFISIFSVVVFLVAAQKNEICYGEFGCFDLQPPWVDVLRPLPTPQPPKNMKLRFYITTRNTIKKDKQDWKIEVTHFYQLSEEDLAELDYQNSRDRTVVLIHGMYVSPEWNWGVLKKMAEAYLLRMDVNVIIMEWASGAMKHLYHQLVANIRVVGAIAAKFLEQLMALTGLTASKIHMIGFSLGGHVAGYIGKRVPNIYRITGLDIAGPLFRDADPRYRLDRADAEHVDVFHTDSLNFIGLGYGPPAGHVDFYFNGGVRQSGCLVNFANVMKNIFKLNLREAVVKGHLLGACSHIKAIEYWIESIENTNCTMWGIAGSNLHVDKMEYQPVIRHAALLLARQWRTNYDCTNYYKCAPVSLDTFDHVSTGTFYVRTRLSSPYCVPNLRMLTAAPPKSSEVYNDILSLPS